MWELSEKFKSCIQSFKDAFSTKSNTIEDKSALIDQVISAAYAEYKKALEQGKTAALIDALCAEGVDGDQTDAIFWLVVALHCAVRDKNSQQVNTLSEGLSWVFKQAEAFNKTAELIDTLCAKRANDSQTNAIFWLAFALMKAVRNNVPQQVKKLSEHLSWVFQQAKTYGKAATLIDALCVKTADGSQTNAIYWLVSGLDLALYNKDSQQITMLSEHLTWVFEQAKTSDKTVALIDALCAKRVGQEQSNAIYWLVIGLSRPVGNKDRQQVDKLSEHLSWVAEQAKASDKTAALISALFVKRADGDQTNAIYWLVIGLFRAVVNKDRQQLGKLSEHLSWVFKQAKAFNKTAALIDALCAKRAGDDQTNAIFWVMDALKKSGDVDTQAMLTKVIIELAMCIGKVSVPTEFSTFMLSHKDSFKKGILSQLAEIQDTKTLEKITDKNTFLGRLIDHNTNPVSRFFEKETDMRDQVNKLIAEKENSSQKHTVPESSASGHISPSKRASFGLSSLSNQQIQYLKKVGASSSAELSIDQLFELDDLKSENKSSNNETLPENIPFAEQLNGLIEGAPVYGKAAQESSDQLDEEQRLKNDLDKALRLVSLPPRNPSHKFYLDQEERVLAAALNVIQCRSNEASMDGFVNAIVKNPNYSHSFGQHQEAKTVMLVRELVRQYPWINMKLKQRYEGMKPTASISRIENRAGLFPERRTTRSDEENREASIDALETLMSPSHTPVVTRVVLSESEQEDLKISAPMCSS